MLLKMKTSMGGPNFSVSHGQELPFDAAFPFSANEVRRFISPEHDLAEFIGDTDELDAWFADAGVQLVPAPAAEQKAAEESKPAPAAKPAAAKSAAKKG